MLVQGPTVMPEYSRNPEATSEAFHEDGWLRTGDAGSLDGEGMLSIVDRIKEVIIVGSCNVYPADVESVLVSCPEIAEPPWSDAQTTSSARCRSRSWCCGGPKR